jgi:hypothetical protein
MNLGNGKNSMIILIRRMCTFIQVIEMYICVHFLVCKIYYKGKVHEEKSQTEPRDWFPDF